MVDLGPISTRTRSNCEGCRKLKLMRDESQLCDKMERMCLCVEGRTATLNGGNRGADSKGNDGDDDEVHMIQRAIFTVRMYMLMPAFDVFMPSYYNKMSCFAFSRIIYYAKSSR